MNYTKIENEIIRSSKLDPYEKSFIGNILSNKENFNISLKMLAERIPCSKVKCIRIKNKLEELRILQVIKIKSESGDWDSNSYFVNIDILFNYLGVVSEKDNGSISERQQVVSERDTKKTNKKTNKNIKKKKKKTNIDMMINAYTDNTELAETLKDFLKMRKGIKAPMTDKGFELLLKKLDRLAGEDIDKKINMLNTSIERCWKSVYEEKEKTVYKEIVE